MYLFIEGIKIIIYSSFLVTETIEKKKRIWGGKW